MVLRIEFYPGVAPFCITAAFCTGAKGTLATDLDVGCACGLQGCSLQDR
jgi:hypothetical protein